MSGLSEAIGAIASTPVLLVASDFDGTLAPIVDHPDDASIDRRAWNALRALADLPHTHAAVVTGRARADVLERVPDLTGTPVSVVGSHGIEAGFTSVSLSADQTERLHRARALLRVEAAQLPGALVETKPASVTLHVRMADPLLAAAAFERVTVGARHIGGLHMLSGDQVLELFVLTPGKDTAVNVLRHRSGATGVIFIGDDITDESVFAQLREDAVGVKVGSSATAADVRVGSQADVAGVLEDLLARRRRWLAERRLVPITHHSILSDQRTVAVVDPEGSIVWACFPRLDSPPLFASMLDTPTRGHWSIRPADPTARVVTEYDGDSFVLRTRWHADARPLLTVTDYFDCTGGRPYQRAGRAELVRVIEGDGPATIRFAPRLDFGRLRTRIEVKPDGLEIDGWHDPIVLRSPGVPWRVIEEGPDQTAIADVDPSRGPVVLELRYGTASLRAAPIEESARRDHSRRFWSGWAGTLRTTRLYPDLVRRSALAIKALCHGPTGAIAAAATTSLPEHLGGVRNWDYRYCWIRDACMSAAALVRIGNTGVALKLLDWLVQVVEQCESPERLRPLYTVSGNPLGPEAEISELTGYGQSRPVRIGNAASHQVQLDVFGPVVELVALMTDGGAPVTPDQWHLVEAMVKAVELRWEEPDHGIWEIRGPKRHHVHSKTMCWFAVDRGLYVAEQAMGLERPDWVRLRDRIAKDVLDRGFNAEAGFFTAAYGETVADAASLAVGLCGLIPADDPRFVATVEAIEHELRDGPAVHRYLGDDGLPGREGAWVICACWLVECLTMIGRTEAARALLHKIAALAGPTGLMSEEWDAQHGIPLGNFPQAYSHLGLINAVMRLESGGLK
jgi:trehalose 6-phosphate phosphatase